MKRKFMQYSEHNELLGLARLMPMAFHGKDLRPIGSELLSRAQRDDPKALLDLSILTQLQGQKDTGLALQRQALSMQQHFTLTPKEANSPLKLLAIYAEGDLMTNTPLEFLAAGAGFTLELLYVNDHDPLPQIIPDHDIAIIAISELDRNQPLLQRLQEWCSDWPRPLLNLPEHIARLTRDQICHRLQDEQTIAMPVTLRSSRATLQAVIDHPSLASALPDISDMPQIIRPVDSHAGQGLARLDCLAALPDYLAQQSADAFFMARYVDYRSNDGLFRKYRIMLIDGKPFLAHMAVSDHWMVHYVNAGMLDNIDKRLEEASVMHRFEDDFAQRHATAFARLHQEVGLDYFGIDCAETRDGRLLLFEVCASLNVHDMDCPKQFPYKKPQMQKLFGEFLSMLETQASELPQVLSA
jgi:hypothetical protein